MSRPSRRFEKFTAYAARFLPGAKRPRTRFLIFAQGRSGSTLLVSLLNCHPSLLCDREIFNRRIYGRILFPGAYVEGCSRRASRGGKSAYGFKVKVYQLTRDQKIRDHKKFLHGLHRSGWKFIHLRRKDILRQSLSNQIYEARGFSSTTDRSHVKPIRIDIDCDRLIRDMKLRIEHNREEDEVLEGIEAIRVRYEDHLLHSENHQATLDDVFAHIGLESVPVRTRLVKLASTSMEDDVANFAALCNRLESEGLDEFLPRRR